MAEADAARTGLSAEEAARRHERDGPNLLPQPDRRNGLRIVAGVLREPMLLFLLSATAVYLLLGSPQDAAILGASVVLVVALTVYQESKSERALQALRDLSSPRARVLRDGATQWLPAREIVVGDVIQVAEGDRVPADARLLEAQDVMIDESLLTGESVPVTRSALSNPGDDASVIRASTLIVRGHGLAEVVAIGRHTMVGGIGTALRSLRSPPTPMQVEIRRAVYLFSALAVVASLLMTVLYAQLRGDWLHGVLAGITLAMANIPEEFPVVLAVFLALGAWRMARHKALVRRPPAIEALGAVTVLCTDKTGTLTQNRMAVAELALDGERWSAPAPLPQGLRHLLFCCERACPDRPFDPMEVAIRSAWAEAAPDASEDTRIREYPLSADLLATAHVWRSPHAQALQVYCKGAPEAVADLCALPEEERARMLRDVAAMGQRGLRVIAAAEARWDDSPNPLPTTPRAFAFHWCGLLGLADPLRPGVREAVAEAQAAGVRVIMLTGDHLETARAIAMQAGLNQNGRVAPGDELEALDDAALRELVGEVDVFSRVRPAQKLRLVEALRNMGQVVAMTGDGVNDAPALVAAHVGVAMGARGTDVAREAASIVLLDDDFVTVVKAIQHGRVIYDNIVRAIRYILAVHVPITGLALLPLLLGGPLVLLPLHVVFLELIIDPASTLVFEREPAARDVMQRPPRPVRGHLLDARTLLGSLAQGALVFATVAVIHAWADALALPSPQQAALSFTALVMGNIGLIVVNRSGAAASGRWWSTNPAFWVVALSALSLLFVVTRLEAPAAWFRFAPPPLDLTVLALLLPWVVLGLVEALRAWIRPRAEGRKQAGPIKKP